MITLDSYECTHCGEWSHHRQNTPTAPHGEPSHCPYCGNETLRWRTDANWQLAEVLDTPDTA